MTVRERVVEQLCFRIRFLYTRNRRSDRLFYVIFLLLIVLEILIRNAQCESYITRKKTLMIQLFPSIFPHRLFSRSMIAATQTILQNYIDQSTYMVKLLLHHCVHISAFFFLRSCIWYENLTQYFKEEKAQALVINRKSSGSWATDIARSIDDTSNGARLSLLLIKFAFFR